MTLFGFLILMLGFFLLPVFIGIFLIPIGGAMILFGTSYSLFCLIPNHQKLEAEIRQSLKKNAQKYRSFFKVLFTLK